MKLLFSLLTLLVTAFSLKVAAAGVDVELRCWNDSGSFSTPQLKLKHYGTIRLPELIAGFHFHSIAERDNHLELLASRIGYSTPDVPDLSLLIDPHTGEAELYLLKGPEKPILLSRLQCAMMQDGLLSWQRGVTYFSKNR